MSTINVEKVTDNDDGSADMVFNCDDETIKLIIEEGMNEVLADLGSKIPVLEVIEPYPTECKMLELTDKQAQMLFQLGTVRALQNGLDIMDKKLVSEMFDES